MKKNIIHVIYPAQKTIAFVHESDETVETILESVFGMFNHGSCQESELFLKSKIRSLSVNDIVCVNGRYFQCAPFGWNEVSPEYVTQLEKDVANAPMTSLHGPWFGLSEVMYARQKAQLV